MGDPQTEGQALIASLLMRHRTELFAYCDRDRYRVAEKRGSGKLPNGRMGVQATLYLTPDIGVHVETRVGGGAFFAGLGVVYRW